MDADSQAREVFDRMATDFSAMLLRPDVDYVFGKTTGTSTTAGNDAMFFYSETPAYFATGPDTTQRSSLSLVGYRINKAFQLERLGKGLTWGGSATGEQGGAAVFLTFPTPAPAANPGATPAPTPTPLPQSTLVGNWGSSTSTGAAGGGGVIGTASNYYTDGSSDDYHVLSSAVFRLEYCFLLKNGNISGNPYIPPNTAPQGMQDVSAIIVTIALLDDASRLLVPQGRDPVTNQGIPELGPMGAELLDFTEPAAGSTTPPVLPATQWQSAIISSTFASQASVPQRVAAAVHVYQRYFYLNNK
jgi:hypothetical protein